MNSSPLQHPFPPFQNERSKTVTGGVVDTTYLTPTPFFSKRNNASSRGAIDTIPPHPLFFQKEMSNATIGGAVSMIRGRSCANSGGSTRVSTPVKVVCPVLCVAAQVGLKVAAVHNASRCHCGLGACAVAWGCRRT